MPRPKHIDSPTRLEWDRYEKAVLRSPPTPVAARARVDITPQAEPAEDEVLRRLAQRSQLMRARSSPLGNVVFLHGITGSDLGVSEGLGQLGSIWVSIPKLIFGGLRKLKLAADGKQEHSPKLKVRPTGINKQFYARAVVALRAQWNVEPYAYDWRKDIDEASDGLAQLIEQRFPGQPVHLVAHSMGGLVARNFIRKHSALWKTMRDPSLARGGRLIMLGTPNYGSFAIAQVLTGTDALLARLERFDLKNNLSELLDITNSFLGTYMLLPAHGKLPATLQHIYEHATWGATPGISQSHLNRAFDFYKTLDAPATMDPERMVYIAGVNQTTISSMKVLSPGEFEYEFSLAGDGRVPHALGLLDGVRSYYIDEAHGDLARNEHVLRVLDDLLQTGTSNQLATTAAGASRSPESLHIVPSTRSYRSGADRAALDILQDMAERTRAAGSADVLSQREQQIAADALLHAALGARTPTIIRSVSAPPPSHVTPTRPGRKVPKLRVSVHYGRIEDFAAPIAVVGHYRGVKPANALGDINARLNDWIGRAVRRGMISGHVGETFFVPTQGTKLAAEGVVIAGMGDFESFTADSLRRVMANVAQGVAALELTKVASVVVGAGAGSLSFAQALKYMLQGFASGLAELDEEGVATSLELRDMCIVECDPERFLGINQELERLVEAQFIKQIELMYVPASKSDRDRARRDHLRFSKQRFKELEQRRATPNSGARLNEVRITVEFDREKKIFRFSALTDDAVVPTRPVSVTVEVADEIARLLAAAQSRREQIERGRVLFDYVVPREFESLFESDTAIRLIVDPTSAALPWEMACLPGARAGGESRWFGTDRRMTRQFKTLLSRSVGVILPRSEKVRALVIADPAPEPEWQLPGARKEGRLVAERLREANRKRVGDIELDIVVEEYIGPDEASGVDLIGKVVSGHYDIIHFAGHGNYRKDDPSKSGWVLSGSRFVTATDVFRSRHAPWLVVANACYSGVMRQDEPYPSLEVACRGAAIAEAFMDRGVRNYLGTGWTVDDGQAERFASIFYKNLLRNELLGEAVTSSRQAIFEDLTGSTWGAYQLYGNPNDKLLPREPTWVESPLAPERPAARKTRHAATRKSTTSKTMIKRANGKGINGKSASHKAHRNTTT